MASYSTKVYVVQRADPEGNLTGPVIAVKLTHFAAHQIAKMYAPAAVLPFVADKRECVDLTEQGEDREPCNQLQMTIFDLV